MTRMRQISKSFSVLLAKALILWDERVLSHLVSFKRGTRIDGFHEYFYRTFHSESAYISRADFDAAVLCFVQEKPRLIDWYVELLTSISSGILWHDKQPIISPRYIITWEALCGDFDPDALLTLDLVIAHGTENCIRHIDELTNWKTIAYVGDNELAQLWKRGISDLHVHVGGARFPQMAWQELLSRESAAALFKELRSIYRREGYDLKLDQELCHLRRRILLDHAEETTTDCDLVSPVQGQWWRWSEEILAQERRMLASAWRTALGSGKNAEDITNELDIYLSAKHRFFRLSRQRTFGAEPGLRYFSARHFRALESRDPRHRWRVGSSTANYGSSVRLRMLPFGDACQQLLESPHLLRLELRIKPFDTARDYLFFFQQWETLVERLRSAHGRIPDIRFAVHFHRTRQHHWNKLKVLDRQTAALRVALASRNADHRRWMSALARIDIAGEERDNPAALFGTHLRLLRNDRDAMSYLEFLNPNDQLSSGLEQWIGLRKRRIHRASPSSNRLGLTIHAGEDFADVLEGLYQIGAALEVCGLGSGDGLGHGLALVTSPESFDKRVGDFRMMSVGMAHDSVCWLYQFVQGQCSGELRNEYNQLLLMMISDTADMIYVGLPIDVRKINAEDHVWVWRKTVMRFVQSIGRADIQHPLLNMSRTEVALRNRGEAMSVDLRRRDIRELVLCVQSELLGRIRERGVIVELNPASNLRISGAGSLATLPTTQLFKEVGHGLLACINTDDPGVFTSCIENEYAMLLQGAIDSDVSEGEARAWLERVRQIGNDLVYWPSREGNL